MTDLRAFVGHSFAEEDAEVVGKFTMFFSQITGLHGNFSWEHAEEAAAKDVSDKVLAILENKNVFIGICTRKERVIAPERLTRPLLRKGSLQSAEEYFEWKTSDWIIQEIGLARGRNMPLILLVEEGLRKPGGIQGNFEYIPFARSNPERSFGKILEMLKHIEAADKIKESTPVVELALDTVQTDKAQEPDSGASEDAWKTPRAGWQLSDYDFALFRATLEDDQEIIKLVDVSFKESEFAASDTGKAHWESNKELFKIRYSKAGSIDLMRRLAKDKPDSVLQQNVGQALAHFSENGAAGKAFLEAAALEQDSYRLQLILADAARQFAKAKDEKSLGKVLDSMRGTQGAQETRVLVGLLADLADEEKQSSIRAAALEFLVEVSPDDLTARFNLAYLYSNIGHDDLSLVHYLAVPAKKRSSTVWNNLGAALGELNMPTKSIASYRQAEEGSETIAMANLAEKLLNNGFMPEAKALIKKALALPEQHKKVSHVLNRIEQVADAEERTKETIIAGASTKRDFYRKCGAAMARKIPAQMDEEWAGSNFTISSGIDANGFHASGSYTRKSANALSIGVGGANELVRYDIKYTGRIVGSAIVGTVKRQPTSADGQPLLNYSSSSEDVLMYVSDDGLTLRVMEGHGDAPDKFYSYSQRTALPSTI